MNFDDSLDDLGATFLAQAGGELFGYRPPSVPSTVAWSRTWGAPEATTDYQRGPGYRSNIAGVNDAAETGAVLLGGPGGILLGRGVQVVQKTPAEVRARIAIVDGRVQSLNADIRQNVARPDFINAWSSFLDNWHAFVISAGSDAAVAATGTVKVDHQIDGFEHDLAGWQDALQREAPSGHFITPQITSTQTSQLPGAPKAAGSGLPWWAISLLTVGAIAGVAYVGYLGYSAVTAPARARQGANEFLGMWGVPGNRTHPMYAHDYDASGEW